MAKDKAQQEQHRKEGSSCIATAARRTRPLDNTGVTVGSEGTGGGSTAGRSTGSARADDQTREPPTGRS